MVCTRCLDTIVPKRFVKGHFAIELCLWLTALIWLPLIFVGVAYTAWHWMSRGKACPLCGAME